MSRTGGVEKQGRIGRVKETKERGKGRVVNKILIKEMEIPDQLTCLLRNLYADQEAVSLQEWLLFIFIYNLGIRPLSPSLSLSSP